MIVEQVKGRVHWIDVNDVIEGCLPTREGEEIGEEGRSTHVTVQRAHDSPRTHTHSRCILIDSMTSRYEAKPSVEV